MGFKYLQRIWSTVVGAWSTGSARREGGGGAGFIIPSALVFGGGSPQIKLFLEEWNGSSWTEVRDTNIARSLWWCWS